MRTQPEKRNWKVEMRAEGGGDAPAKLVGYAAVYGQLSEPIGGMFYERIAAGAFTRALKSGPDVRLLVNHNADLILGRTRAGTLRLSEDEKGLRIENDPPDTTLGRDTLISVRRGDMDQMSFAFFVPDGGDTWTEEIIDGQLWPVRTLTDINFDDVSVVTYPAYIQTSVQVRSIPRGLDPYLAEKILEFRRK